MLRRKYLRYRVIPNATTNVQFLFLYEKKYIKGKTFIFHPTQAGRKGENKISKALRNVTNKRISIILCSFTRRRKLRSYEIKIYLIAIDSWKVNRGNDPNEFPLIISACLLFFCFTWCVLWDKFIFNYLQLMLL